MYIIYGYMIIYLYMIWIYLYIYIYIHGYVYIYTPRPGEGRHIGAWGYIKKKSHISTGTYIVLCNIYIHIA